MKQLFALSIAALLSCLLVLTALAGPEALPSGKEMKQVAPAPEGCDYVWTGFYVGARAGYGWNDNELSARGEPEGLFDIDPGHQAVDNDGFVGGVEWGRNW